MRHVAFGQGVKRDMSQEKQRVDPRRVTIGERIAAERKAKLWDQQALASALGNSKRAVAAWETGESMPTAELLARFDEVGLDVLFVLTGRRGGNLSHAEGQLVDTYRRIDAGKRTALHVTADALAADLPVPAANSFQQVFHGSVGQAVGQAGSSTNTTYIAPAKRPARGRG